VIKASDLFLPSMYYPLKNQCRVILDNEKKNEGDEGKFSGQDLEQVRVL
jgi:hypothetical protein